MIWCRRARQRARVNKTLLSTIGGHWHGSAIGAAVVARRLFAKDSCLVVGPREPINVEEDLTVTISAELEAQILRYHHVEKWRVGTIARHLQLHYDTVARVFAQAGVPSLGPPTRPLRGVPLPPLLRHNPGQFPPLTPRP